MLLQAVLSGSSAAAPELPRGQLLEALLAFAVALIPIGLLLWRIASAATKQTTAVEGIKRELPLTIENAKHGIIREVNAASAVSFAEVHRRIDGISADVAKQGAQQSAEGAAAREWRVGMEHRVGQLEHRANNHGDRLRELEQGRES